MEPLNIGRRREVCWDEALIDSAEGVQVRMHRPEFRNVAFVADAPWEGDVSGYFTFMPDDGRLRMYYRGSRITLDADGVREHPHTTVFCYGESDDGGRTFRRVNVNKHAFWGTKDNNIILNNIRDNMSFFKDTNPDCPADELYKGLAEEGETLAYYKSADGVNFERVRTLVDDGAYDSLNVAMWDSVRKKYFLFYRGIHGGGSNNGKWTHTEDHAMHTTIIRDIRVRTSEDFVTWDEPRMLEYDPEREDLELYTNQIQPYYRAKHMYIGFPMRYTDRYMDSKNFYHLPDREHREMLIRNWGRSGTAMTDGIIMTSRDGYHFRRTEEAFFTPGPERGTNWYYGDGSLCYGMFETPSDIPGAPNEISIYLPADYRVNPVKILRYAVRLDGFFSWRADYPGGKVTTKPFVFEGDAMHINFATSCAGYVQIRMLDEDGCAIEGYDSGRMFGDSVSRPVDFDAPVCALSGKTVRMEITMKDADLYSFVFRPDYLAVNS